MSSEPASKLEAPWENDPAVKARLAELTPNQQRIVRSLNAKSKMMAMTAGWLLAAGAAGIASPAAAQAAPGIQIVDVSPAVQSFDGIVRSQISPDGDHVNDHVAYTVQTTPGAPVQLTVNYWLVGQHQIVTLGPVVADSQGRAVIVWDGRDASGNVVDDGGYNLTFCHPNDPGAALVTPALPPAHLVSQGLQCGCGVIGKIVELRKASSVAAGAAACGGNPDAVVHKRNLSVTLPDATVRSVQRGSATKLNIDSDRTDGFSVKLTSDDSSIVYKDYGAQNAGSINLPIPAELQPGQYRVDVADGAGTRRQVPLVVRAQPNLLLPLKSKPKGKRKGKVVQPVAPRTVLVASPSLTWRAYSFSDANFDGFPESWYTYPNQSGGQRTVSLVAPFERPGLGMGNETERDHSAGYWQVLRQHPNWRVEVVTDYEIGLMPQSRLNAYAAIILPGHTEYYTAEMLDHMKAFRRSGGHLVFWGANNMYARVIVNEQVDTEYLDWRPIYTPNKSRVDFPLMGNGYVFCCFSDDQFDYEATARGLRKFPWLYAGTGLNPGDRFGHLGNEIDTAIPRLAPALRTEIAGTTMDYFDPNFKRQMNPRVSMLWLPARRYARGRKVEGAVLSAGSLSFLTAITDASDPVDAARVARIVTNVQTYVARLPHPAKIKPRPKPKKPRH
jgi:hypothetical protein